MLGIIGCGNLTRSDDGVGVIVVHRLMKDTELSSRDDVLLFDAGTAGIEVMFRASECEALIIIDANQSGAGPGTILEIPGSEISNPPTYGLNLHNFRWDHALFAGRKIYGNKFPTEVQIFLIEAKDVSFGLELSAEVEKSAQKVSSIIAERVKVQSYSKSSNTVIQPDSPHSP